jgi:membrane protease YdiL (CAAX protease family)
MQSKSILSHPAVFFISRIFILGGMSIFFMSVCSVISMLLCQPLFGIHFLDNFSLLTQYDNPNVVKALKFIQSFTAIGAFLIPAIYFPKALEQEKLSLARVNKPLHAMFYFIAAGIYLSSAPFLSMLVQYNESFVFPDSMKMLEQKLRASEDAAAKITEVFLSGTTGADLLVNMLVMAFIPAITEELFFRGTLLPLIAKCFNNKHAAVISSAIIFSAIHGQFFGFVPRVVLGVMLGYLFVFSQSIYPSIILHLVNNAIATMLYHYSMHQDTAFFLSDTYQFPFWIIGISLIVTFLLIWYSYKLYHQKLHYNGE